MAEFELKSMLKLWTKAMSNAGMSGLALSVGITEDAADIFPFAANIFPFTAYMSLRYRSGVYIGPMITAWARRTAEDAYACLLELYGKGEHFKSTAIWNFFSDPKRLFPPCSSAAELELKLAVECMI